MNVSKNSRFLIDFLWILGSSWGALGSPRASPGLPWWPGKVVTDSLRTRPASGGQVLPQQRNAECGLNGTLHVDWHVAEACSLDKGLKFVSLAVIVVIIVVLTGPFQRE